MDTDIKLSVNLDRIDKEHKDDWWRTKDYSGTNLPFLTGRIIFGKSSYALSDAKDTGELIFYCGPETTDGYLWDQVDEEFAEQLEKLFSNTAVSIMDSENSHSIEIEHASPKEVWQTIKDRLKMAGAIERDDSEFE